MAGSSLAIDYALRPAKHIERRMMAEAFRHLSVFQPIETYRYIGMGGIQFRDFMLFHRSLGIRDMVSMEKDTRNQDRYTFNRPFQCVQMEFGFAERVLPRLSWDNRSIIWLDYDYRLTADVLAAVRFACASASSGSVVIVTLNVHTDGEKGSWLEYLVGELGESMVPSELTKKNFQGWGAARQCRRILTNQIADTLTERNGDQSEGGVKFHQIFNFEYQDSARMLTVGGLLFNSSQQLEACHWERMGYYRSEETSYRIEVPNLTQREQRHLETQLPQDDLELVELPGLQDDDLRRFADMYRYYPTYAEMVP